MLFLTMLLLGAIVGFVGAGGGGVAIALMTVGFGIPIHTALAVALSSMIFTMLTGALSHFREKAVIVKTGAIIGAGGIVGAFIGAEFADTLPASLLNKMTALMLALSASILYLKMYHEKWLHRTFHLRETLLEGRKLWIYGILTGIITGFLSGAFGIGAAAFIQLALMTIFGVPLLKAIGTCMMIIFPLSCAGGLGYLINGHLDIPIFLQTLCGMMIGAWFGAKGTHMAPISLLKFATVALPTTGALLMLLR